MASLLQTSSCGSNAQLIYREGPSKNTEKGTKVLFRETWNAEYLMLRELFWEENYRGAVFCKKGKQQLLTYTFQHVKTVLVAPGILEMLFHTGHLEIVTVNCRIQFTKVTGMFVYH